MSLKQEGKFAYTEAELDVVMSIVLVSTFGITPKLELKLCSFCIIPDSLLKLKPLA